MANVNDTKGAIQLVSIAQIVPGKNHRTKTDDVRDLARSIETVGLLQPVVVRKVTGGFELIAGHRRLAALALLKWDAVDAVVMSEVTDAEAIEIQIIENLQREGVHPIEEAEGFRDLATAGKMEVQAIADRVGRSARYVYDRLRLLSLIGAAKTLFRANKITAAHAVLLARLRPEAQKAAIDPDSKALFEREEAWGLFTHDDVPEDGAENRWKLRTVDELRAWIAKHVKFETAREAVDDLFPEARQFASLAKAEKVKVVQITHDAMVHPDARDDERVFGPRSWKKVDPEKPCPKAGHRRRRRRSASRGFVRGLRQQELRGPLGGGDPREEEAGEAGGEGGSP